jgi:hypothetical protein
MNTAAGPRQSSTGKDRPEKLSKEQRANDTAKTAGKLFTFTIDASTAQVVRFEALDASGAHCELSDEEKASLARGAREGLEEAVEEAFEAGIDCVLGGENGRDESEESDRDAELRHLLLTPLIEHSPARRLLQREVLNRVILGTLIHDSMTPPPAGVSNPASTMEAERAGANRAN